MEFQFQKLLPVLFGTHGMLLSTIEVCCLHSLVHLYGNANNITLHVQHMMHNSTCYIITKHINGKSCRISILKKTLTCPLCHMLWVTFNN